MLLIHQILSYGRNRTFFYISMWEGYHFFSGYNMPVGVPSRRKQNMALQLAEAAGLRVQLPNAHHWGRAAAVESRRVRDRRIGWETWAQAAVACVSSAPLLFLSALVIAFVGEFVRHVLGDDPPPPAPPPSVGRPVSNLYKLLPLDQEPRTFFQSLLGAQECR